MAQNFTKSDEALNASAEGMLIIKQFLDDNYLFRRNLLNGKVEFLTRMCITAISSTIWQYL